ncbi:MAG: hypothetical protein KKE61_06245, partial [Proteobacteria bacterium]|nr:hypothetical protein [Pseudomonadota bacterium]
AGIYGSEPLTGEFKDYDVRDKKDSLAGNPPVKIKHQVNGPGTIETYTVIYSMDQKPSYAVLYGKTRDNFRFIARTKDHPDIFKLLITKSQVGQPVALKFDVTQNINIAELV